MRKSLNLLLAAKAAGENGIGRVISMLEDMKSKSEAQMQEEAIKFKGFQQWCTSTTTELAASIEKLNEEISEGKNQLAAHTAKSSELGEKIEKNNGEIAKITIDRAAKKAAREEDNAEFLKVKKDYEVSITAVNKAIEVLKAQPANVAQGSEPDAKKAALLEVEASSMARAQKDLISMLVTSAPPKGAAYENQSGGVVQMLKDLAEQFQEELNKEQEMETKKQGESNKLVMSLTGQIENLQSETKRLNQGKSKADKLAGEAQQEIQGDSQTLAIDSKSEKEVKANCELKDAEFADRTELRDGELETLAQVLEVMAGIKDKKTAAGLIETSSDEALSFLQMSSWKLSSENDQITRVLSYLQKQGKIRKSKTLQLLALQASANPAFKKINKMIQDMIDRLKAESLAETGKFGECSVLMSENKSDLESSQEKQDEVKASIDEELGTVGTTAQKIKELTAADNNAKSEMMEATKVRNDDSVTNAATIKEAREGENAVEQALGILNDFYSGAAKATSLMQQSPVEADDQPDTWDSSFQGNQQGSSDVVNFLEVIQADFLKLRSETEASEAQDQKAYEEFVKESQLATASRKSNLEHAKATNAAAKKDLSAAKSSLADQQKVHAGLVEQKRVIEQEKGCAAMSDKTPEELYENRSKARAQEIEDLKNALVMLKK